jgi:hypothetical protein
VTYLPRSSFRANTYTHDVRDREVIESELRLLVAIRRTIREEGGPPPSMAVLDALLDELESASAIDIG